MNVRSDHARALILMLGEPVPACANARLDEARETFQAAKPALDAVTALMADENPDVKAAAEYAVSVLRGMKEAVQ